MRRRLFLLEMAEELHIKHSSNSIIIQGNKAPTMIVLGNSSPQKQELIRIFDKLSLREQTKLLNFAYNLEEAQ